MSKKVPPPTLLQHWVHSHEEDTDSESIYRPASYKFPPSRGRKSFDIRPNGKLIEHPLGAADVSQQTTGKWKLAEDKTLAFFSGTSQTPTTVVHISSVEKNRLILKK